MTDRRLPSQLSSDPRRGPATVQEYLRHREDGWPLCPGCGEDELWSAEIPATPETIVNCLRCGWQPLGGGARTRV